MQSIDQPPYFDAFTIIELEENLKKDKVFQKDFSSNLKRDITSLIHYWNIKCSRDTDQVKKISAAPEKKALVDDVINNIQPNINTTLDLVITSSEDSDDDLSVPNTPPNFNIQSNALDCAKENSGNKKNDSFALTTTQSKHFKDDKLPSTPTDFIFGQDQSKNERKQNTILHSDAASHYEDLSDAVEEGLSDSVKGESSESHQVSIYSDINKRSIKKSFSSFITKLKGVFAKKSKVGSSVKGKHCSSVNEKRKTLDLTDPNYVQALFDRLQVPLTPDIKTIMERKKFYSLRELSFEIHCLNDEKARVNALLESVGLPPWKVKIKENGEFTACSELDLPIFWTEGGPYGPPLWADPNDGRVWKYDDSDREDLKKSTASFLDEFEERQKRGVFSYMDNYVEPPMSDGDSDSEYSNSHQLHRLVFEPDEATLTGDMMKGNPRSSVDQLLDDVWKRSEEYQEYFNHMDEDVEHEDSYYGMPLKLVTDKRNVSSSIWNPPISHAIIENNVRSHVAHSRTEVNMRTQDLVPYVKIDTNTNSKEYRIPRKQVKPLVVDIDDGALYKRSISAYSALKDYDLAWQKTFHDEQHDIDKVQTTFQSISWALYSIIRRNHFEGNFECDPLFISPDISYDDDMWEAEPLTEWSDIFMEMAAIFERTDLTSEHAIIAFIYVERMIKTSGQCLFDGSWQRILMLSLLTAAKVWEDCSIYNSDYSQLFPDVSTKAINQMEVHYLEYLDWNVNVKCSEFASTYFQLRQPQDV
ncbi:hypothetical protein G6F37_005146 [Rhizopus arrhizus]|nr:hypothetical protein G6F38_005724 [Rhizopus arrhizus]KAG1159162.1 hypothetical protein G6F37_005146 [Rhizopus arrhizus]